jgi:hypothetical protein
MLFCFVSHTSLAVHELTAHDGESDVSAFRLAQDLIENKTTLKLGQWQAI